MPDSKLVTRLQATIGLSDDDRTALANMPVTLKTFAPGEYILREGHRARQCALLVSGFLFRQKMVGDREQILSFYVPGDMPDLQTLHLPVMDHNLNSSGQSTVAFIAHNVLEDMLANSRSLTHVFWRETLVDASIYREWVANLGSKDALARVAHVICEIAARLEIVGLVQQDTFQVPFTQRTMADATGLSTVHINRTLQELRQRGLITWLGKAITLSKRKELEIVADFRFDYLHQGLHRSKQTTPSSAS